MLRLVVVAVLVAVLVVMLVVAVLVVVVVMTIASIAWGAIATGTARLHRIRWASHGVALAVRGPLCVCPLLAAAVAAPLVTARGLAVLVQWACGGAVLALAQRRCAVLVLPQVPRIRGRRSVSQRRAALHHRWVTRAWG